MRERSEARDVDVDSEAAGPPGDPEAVARIICLRMLDRQARTRAELEQALAKRGVPAEAAVAVLDRFSEVGLIDDAALAARFASVRHSERGLGRRAISDQLRRKGIDAGTIAAAIEPIDSAQEASRARELVDQRLRRLAGLPPPVQARRLIGLLARKGYSPGLAADVVRRALREFGAEQGCDVEAGI